MPQDESASGKRPPTPSRSGSTTPHDPAGYCEEGPGPVGGTALVDGFAFTSRPIVWAEVDGMAVAEGDIIIGSIAEARARDVSRAGSDFADPAEPAEPPGPEDEEGVGISGARFRWPGATIAYEVASNVANPSRVARAIAHWESRTPFRFVERTTQPDWLRFVAGGGCASWVGRRRGRQDITLGSGCSTGSTIHEIGHALGLWHEQSREDRNRFVRIVWANIEAEREHNFSQHISDGVDLGAYDFGSIMHYSPSAFSRNGQETIEALVPLPAGVRMGQRNGLSAGDIAAIRRMYPKLAWPGRGRGRGDAAAVAGRRPGDAVPSGLRFGIAVIGPLAVEGVASVHVSVEDARIADAASVRLAEAELSGIRIAPGVEIPFTIDVDDVPSGATVRVHVDYSGDRSLAPGDQYSTVSVPADVLGDDPDRAGRVAVEQI
jgi:hypothetical protein